MTHYKMYPFTAIIGQDLMKLALILNAINPRIGGVLIKGEKGTAKSTAVRALADLLPQIPIIKDCQFNCNPENEKEACHSCQHRIIDRKIGPEDIEMRNMRVINLPINATEDRVVGTINIEKALTKGLKALEPGILAESHRNILYIDEVNLLADSVADILLDAAAMGINIIEREGISLHHPAKFILVGTMNPEEGHLRPQLLDRFGLSVEVERIYDVSKRVEIIKNLEAYHRDPTTFHDTAEPQQHELREKIIAARKLLPNVTITDKLLEKIAQIGITFETDGHRADITIDITAKTLAAYSGRDHVTLEDIQLAAKLALPHRMRKLPFEDDHLDQDKLEEILKSDSDPPQEAPNEGSVRDDDKNDDLHPEQTSKGRSEPPKDDPPNSTTTNMREKIFEVGRSVNVDKILDKQRIREEMNATGNLVSHPTSSHKGKYVGIKKSTQLNIPRQNDIAIIPTLNAASSQPTNQAAFSSGNPVIIKDEDIRLKKRHGKSSYLIIFCLDASGSMGVQDRMEMAKGAIFSLLQKNYINRDKVSLVVFRQESAEVVLPPTRSTDLAHKLMKNIPTGGATPLAQGLLKALSLAEEEHRKETGYIPLVILISDGRGNISFKDTINDPLKVASEIAKSNVGMIVIDTEQSSVKIGLSRELASITNAAYYHIDDLNIAKMEQIFLQEGIFHAEA